MRRTATAAAIALCLWTPGSAARPAPSGDEVTDFGALADDFVRSHVPEELLGERAPGTVSIEELLDVAYLHVDLGVLRVHYPKRAFLPLGKGRTEFETYKGKPNPKVAAKELSAIGEALVELQLRWIELVGQEELGKKIDERRADEVLPGYAAVHQWVSEGWRGKTEEKEIVDALRAQRGLVEAAKGGPMTEELRASLRTDLLELITDEGSDVRQALAAFSETMRAAKYWAGEKPTGGAAGDRPLDFVLCPTRGDIVGFALHAARARDMKQLTWHPGIFEYTQFSLIGLQLNALHYAEEGDAENLHGGKYMADVDQPGGVVQQHAVRYAMNLLLEYYLGPSYLSEDDDVSEEQKLAQRELGALLGGLRKYMVTYMYGKNQVRDEGDEASRTHARSMFIAGGNSEGGSLGMMPAENSRWRKRANKDGDFLGDLLDNVAFERVGSGGDAWMRATVDLQPQGSKRKNSHTLESPFLARTAKSVLPPVDGPADEKEKDEEKRLQVRGELAKDYVGFVRAYEIAFYKWLVEEYAGAEGGSLAKHAQLFRELNAMAATLLDPEGPAYDLSLELRKVIEEVYGLPLTSPPGSAAGETAPKTLEQRFLDWLAQQG